MTQADLFRESEGDAWYERNKERLGQHDPVSAMIEACHLSPTSVLEVGCADGWRLAKLRDKYQCEVFGVEPSVIACLEAAVRGIPVVPSTAAKLMVFGSYDLVIFGFCLYLTDPSDWLRITAEADRVLAPGGHLLIHDFNVESRERSVVARRYQHRDGILSYHYDFAKLWQSHPLYELVERQYDGEQMLTLLRKQPVTTIGIRE